MALQKQIKLINGVELPNAYLKISEFVFYNQANNPSFVKIEISVFKDQESRQSGLPEVTKFTHKFGEPKFSQWFSLSVLNIEGKNMISQAYELLKTLTTYSGATNVQDDKEA